MQTRTKVNGGEKKNGHACVSYLHCPKEATVWRAGWHFHTETLSSDTERRAERRRGESGREGERERGGGTEWQGECGRGKR